MVIRPAGMERDGEEDVIADEEEDDEAAAAAEALMASVQRGFAAAKKAGVPAATRLMKELRAVCAGDSGVEIRLLNDSLQQWEILLFDWSFDEASALHQDLKALSEAADDLIPLKLRISFPDDFPFAPPLVFCTAPQLSSEYVFDGALCMEMCAAAMPRIFHHDRNLPWSGTARDGCMCMCGVRAQGWSTGSQRTATSNHCSCRSAPSSRTATLVSPRSSARAETRAPAPTARSTTTRSAPGR